MRDEGGWGQEHVLIQPFCLAQKDAKDTKLVTTIQNECTRISIYLLLFQHRQLQKRSVFFFRPLVTYVLCSPILVSPYHLRTSSPPPLTKVPVPLSSVVHLSPSTFPENEANGIAPPLPILPLSPPPSPSLLAISSFLSLSFSATLPLHSAPLPSPPLPSPPLPSSTLHFLT